MSGYRRVNYYELCRLCTSSEGSKMHIFREEGKRRQLSSKIQLCLPLQVNEEDSLPKIVCNDCVDKLESFFDFRSSCVNAEAMLEGYFTSLRYSNDFNKEGKVYVKDVSPCKGQECDNSKKSLEVTSSQTQMPTPGRGQGGKGPPVTSVPVTLDSLTNLVQAAAIQIVGQAEPEDNRLQQYKCAVQIQPGPVLESSNSDNRFTYQPCSNNPITTTTTVLKSVQAQHFVSPSKQDKSSEDEEHRVEEESSDDENETSLQPTIAFTSSNAGQDVLVHFDFNKEKESPQNVFHTSDGINRNSVVQIGEFLRMKTVEIETGDEVNVRTESNGSCEHCGKELTEEERESHSLTCSPLAENTLEEKANITYRCDICNKLFKRKEHLFQHKKLHTGERPYTCRDCGKAFSRKEHLVRHSVSHTGQKQYSCDICGKSFGRKDNVRKHRKTHGLSGPYACETCGKTFIVKPYYLMHKSSHCSAVNDSDSSSFPYRCDICNKGFLVKQYLTTHKLRHRNKVAAAPADSTEHCDSLEVPPTTVQEVTILPPNILHEAHVFQATTTTPQTTFICTTPPNQLLATYRKLNQT